MKHTPLKYNLRNHAAKVLLQVHQGRSLTAVLPRALKQVSPKDEALLQQLCYGTIRYHPRLVWMLSQLMDKPLKKKEKELEQLLLLGLYQLFMLSIPSYAVLNETVHAVVNINKSWAKGLTNAVLRNALRRADTLNLTHYPTESAQYMHPDWLITRLKNAWPQHWRTLCEANNTPAPMTLRVNVSRISRDHYLDTLRQADLPAAPCQYSLSGITLEHSCDVTQLPGFHQGDVSVQDEAAQLAAQWLGALPQERILDACAAPGGKTAHLLESCHNRLQVTALDNDDTRLARIHDNLQRLNLNARILGADLLKPDTWWNGQPFDRILLDAPCSATGVIRRHPDIKQLRRCSDIATLAQLQRQMLATVWQLLASGGTLLYATCSVLPDENSQQIQQFLRLTPDAKLDPLPIDWGINTGFGQQLLPEKNRWDGFFYARLKKCSL